ncbi:MAG: hypothetical protein ACYC59_02750 [Anaerolineaceae bacterium]
MKKGWKIALIVVGAFLAICGVFFLVASFTRHGIQRGFDSFGYRERISNDTNDRWSNMPHGMMRGWNRSTSNEDFYLEHWAAILGIPEDELQTRLDSGESLESIAESLGVEMPCWDTNTDDAADLNTTPSDFYGWANGAGMCF